MKTKTVVILVVLLIFAAVVGPFAAHVIGFLVGSAVTIACVGGAAVGGYKIGRANERRQLGRGL